MASSTSGLRSDKERNMKSYLVVSIALPLALTGFLADAQTARTPWGAPDLQGTWSNATLTPPQRRGCTATPPPRQRPAELKDKEFFTPEEAKAYVRQRLSAVSGDENIQADKQSGNVGSSNAAWMERGTDVAPRRRPSLFVDRKNGRVPPFTPDAQRQF